MACNKLLHSLKVSKGKYVYLFCFLNVVFLVLWLINQCEVSDCVIDSSVLSNSIEVQNISCVWLCGWEYFLKNLSLIIII